MDVALRYFDGCPNWQTARERLEQAMAELGLTDEVQMEKVSTQEDAERLRFVGSPTILLDGRDPFLTEDGPYGLTCRVYWTPEGAGGSPTLAQLLEALRAA